MALIDRYIISVDLLRERIGSPQANDPTETGYISDDVLEDLIENKKTSFDLNALAMQKANEMIINNRYDVGDYKLEPIKLNGNTDCGVQGLVEYVIEDPYFPFPLRVNSYDGFPLTFDREIEKSVLFKSSRYQPKRFVVRGRYIYTNDNVTTITAWLAPEEEMLNAAINDTGGNPNIQFMINQINDQIVADAAAMYQAKVSIGDVLKTEDMV